MIKKKKRKLKNLAVPTYRRFKDNDFDKLTFVLDLSSFLLQNLNPLGLDKKLETEAERNDVKMV